MPIPQQKEGESDEEFMERCLQDETMQEEYPRRDGEKVPEQRYAVCRAQIDEETGDE